LKPLIILPEISRKLVQRSPSNPHHQHWGKEKKKLNKGGEVLFKLDDHFLLFLDERKLILEFRQRV
jgi:hypothetical protein